MTGAVGPGERLLDPTRHRGCRPPYIRPIGTRGDALLIEILQQVEWIPACGPLDGDAGDPFPPQRRRKRRRGEERERTRRVDPSGLGDGTPTMVHPILGLPRRAFRPQGGRIDRRDTPKTSSGTGANHGAEKRGVGRRVGTNRCLPR